MATDLDELARLLGSPRKEVRLKALKLILRQPDVSPLQIVRALCSEDNRNFEFQNEFDLRSCHAGELGEVARRR